MQFSDSDLLVMAKNSLEESCALYTQNEDTRAIADLLAQQSIAASLLLLARNSEKERKDVKKEQPVTLCK